MTKNDLEQSLRDFPGVDAVSVVGNGKLVAEMIVRDFDGVDEGDRQERIYAFLRARFSEDEMQAVEYIFTNAPGEAPQ